MYTEYKGIDYGLGMCNTSHEGIRYGVISANRVASHIWDILEPVYTSYCSECDEDLEDMEDDICPHCKKTMNLEDIMGNEPSGWKYSDPDLELRYSPDTNDIWVLRSNVAVNAQFCSPCAPGAGNIECVCKDGPLTYALPLDLFDEYFPAPYSQDDLVEI